MKSPSQDRATTRNGLFRVRKRNAGVAAALALALLLVACSQGRITGGPSATATPALAATATPLPQIDPPVTLAQMAYDSRSGAVVLFGGQAPGASSEATWVWNSAGWHQARTASAPDNTRNTGSAIAYDSTHDQIVFFEYVSYSSAAGPQNLPQTWTFDGTNWAKHAASLVAPPLGAVLADDPAGGGVLAFGGITGYINGGKQPVFATATWHWDGTRWTQLHPPSAPTSDDAGHGSMTTDTITKQVVLVNQHTGMVWTWDGATWTAHPPASAPPARDDAALVFDGQSRSVVLISGYDHSSGQQTGGMWQWNGSTWSQLSVTGTPPTIGPENAVYDAQMQVLVAYVGQTWSWDGDSAWRKLG